MKKTLQEDKQLLRRMEVIKSLVHLHPIPWDLLLQQAKEAGCSPRTLQRWIKRYREEGPEGLQSKEKSRTHKNWESFIQTQYLDPSRPSIASVHSKCVQKAQRAGVNAPSYPTVLRIIHSIPSSVKSYHRSRKEFRDKFQVTGDLYQATYPGELYLIDHHELDVLVIHEEHGQKKAIRPWLTGVLDQYSRALVGYYLGLDPPSSRRVALALRHAILPKNDPQWLMCGIPTMIRHDHGQDLVSKHIQQVKIDLKISDLPKEKGNPRGNAEKERFFGTVAQWVKELPGWTGNSVKERPQDIRPSLTLADLDKRFRSFVRDYHRRKHSTTMMTPFDRWNTGLIPQLPESEASLDLLLLPVARFYKIRRDGIHFQTNRYWSDDLLLYIGETAILRYDPLRLDEISVYVGKARIGEAIRVEGTRQSYGDYRKKRAKQARLIREYVKNGDASQSKQIASELSSVVENKAPTEAERLASVYLQELEKRQEGMTKEELKLFPVKEKGEDWW